MVLRKSRHSRRNCNRSRRRRWILRLPRKLFRRWKHFRSSPIQPKFFLTKLGSENNLMDTRLVWLKFALTFSPWVAPTKGGIATVKLKLN